ncbi:hypothetical protein [Caldicellulosiruptor acetigenus]|uniref:hypothetical protein n=1 Tax=Caldicellulosiruptor acetigenus TaxID=301953 RepID=UPI0003F617F6|nr:hypothetical protein [Caldicellulosiruptor acetigenus]WAM35767.1 hypothetical protein OTK01_002125 [Caldicellulosiruptor acetigenus]
MYKKKVLVSIISILVLFGAILISIGVKSNQDITNEQEIKKTVIGALKIWEKLVFPSEYTKSPEIKIPAEVIEKKIKEVTDECKKYFSSKSGWLANRLEVYRNAVLAEAYPSSSIRTAEDKINDIKFLEIKINGDTAMVVVDVYEENKAVLSGLDESKIPPAELNKINNIDIYKITSGKEEDIIKKKKEIEEQIKKLPKKTFLINRDAVIRYYYNLAKENGEWKITSENLDYHPGYKPQN